MATAKIEFGKTAQFTGPIKKALQDKFVGKTREILIKNAALDVDDELVDQKTYGADLWKTLCDEFTLKPIVKTDKVTSAIKGPGTHEVDIHIGGESTYKGKIKLVVDPKDKSVKAAKAAPEMKKGEHPASIALGVTGLNVNLLPAEYKEDLKHLLGEMRKAACYEWVGGSGSHKGFAISIDKHPVHEQPGQGRKTYIDSYSRGTSTTWRLYFDIAFNAATKVLTVTTSKIAEDH